MNESAWINKHDPVVPCWWIFAQMKTKLARFLISPRCQNTGQSITSVDSALNVFALTWLVKRRRRSSYSRADWLFKSRMLFGRSRSCAAVLWHQRAQKHTHTSNTWTALMLQCAQHKPRVNRSIHTDGSWKYCSVNQHSHLMLKPRQATIIITILIEKLNL